MRFLDDGRYALEDTHLKLQPSEYVGDIFCNQLFAHINNFYALL
jgi:hypothetical protein